MIDRLSPIEIPLADEIGDAVVAEQVLAALGRVIDPELCIDVVALGLIYDIRIHDGNVELDMTLTTPGCPVSEQLAFEVEDAVRDALPDAEVTVNVVWDPPWTPERLSPIANAQLGYGGTTCR